MHFCYVDEAGCTGMLPSATSPIQPVFSILGLVVPRSKLGHVTREFVRLKQTYFPGLMKNATFPLDRILVEVKGADLRADVRSGSSRRRRAAVGFIDHVLRLVEAADAKLFGRVWVKGIALPIASRSIYTASVQAICQYFQEYLGLVQTDGLVIADSRTKAQNAAVAHSIFTKKFQKSGDDYDSIIEMPTFGHSDNHAGLQIADLICSALVFPMATRAFCYGTVQSVHVHDQYRVFIERFGERLKKLQFRYRDENGRWRGGLTVSDALGKRPGSLLFKPPT